MKKSAKPPTNKNPVLYKILAVVCIIFVLCSTFICGISASYGGSYPTYTATAIAPLETYAFASSPTNNQSWSGRIDEYLSGNQVPYGWGDESADDFSAIGSGNYRELQDGYNTIRLSWGAQMNYYDTQRTELQQLYENFKVSNGEAVQAFRNTLGLCQIQNAYYDSSRTYNTYIAHTYSGFAVPREFVNSGFLYYSLYKDTEWNNPAMYVDALLSYTNASGVIVELRINDWCNGIQVSDTEYAFNIGQYLWNTLTSQPDFPENEPNYMMCHALSVGTDSTVYACRLYRLGAISTTLKTYEALKADYFGANVYSGLITTAYKNGASPDNPTIPVPPLEPADLTQIGNFLTKAVSGIFAFEIFPGFSLGGIFTVVVMVMLVFAFLKIFAGG